MSRLVLVDDTSSAISYDGPWLESRGTADSWGNFGPPFQGTLHAVSEDASLSFSFTGSRIIVLGSCQVSRTADGYDPSWECFVDGTSIGSKTPILAPQNHWVLCEADGLSSGSHSITVRVKATTNTFYFDFMQFAPPSGQNLGQSLVQVDSSDSVIQYGTGWQNLRDIAQMTTQEGSKATVAFTGTSLGWYGFIPGDYPRVSTSATYSVDGQTPVTFQLRGGGDDYNQLLFQTPQLSAGQHQVEVTHNGNSGTTPLTLDYVVVQGSPQVAIPPSSPPSGTTAVPSSGSSSSASSGSSSGVSSATRGTSSNPSGTNTPSNIPSTLPSGAIVPDNPPTTSGSAGGGNGNGGAAGNSNVGSEEKAAPVGAIAGGVAGGVVVIILVALLLLCLRRRKKQRQQENYHGYISQPNSGLAPLSPGSSRPNSSTVVEPFTLGPSAPVTYSPYSPNGHSPQSSTSGGPSGKFAFAPLRYGASSPSSGQVSHLPQNASSTSSGPSIIHNNSVTDDSHVNLLATNKAREAQAESAALLSAEGSLSSPPTGSAVPRFVRHEDSGFREPPSRAPQEVVELPPLYTPG